MNQIRLSELFPGEALKWPEFTAWNIPNTRLETRGLTGEKDLKILENASHFPTEHPGISRLPDFSIKFIKANL